MFHWRFSHVQLSSCFINLSYEVHKKRIHKDYRNSLRWFYSRRLGNPGNTCYALWENQWRLSGFRSHTWHKPMQIKVLVAIFLSNTGGFWRYNYQTVLNLQRFPCIKTIFYSINGQCGDIKYSTRVLVTLDVKVWKREFTAFTKAGFLDTLSKGCIAK